MSQQTWSREWKTGSWIQRLSGLTYEHSKVNNGVANWISSLPGHHVSPLVRQQGEITLITIYGPKFFESRQIHEHSDCSEKTYLGEYPNAGELKSKSRLPEWARHISAIGCSFLATPTATANQTASSMMKHPGCRALKMLFGTVYPEAYEWMMGFPKGWTDCDHLEMPSFLQWQHTLTSDLDSLRNRASRQPEQLKLW